MSLVENKEVPTGELPWGVHNGAQAITVQGYIERNVKAGRQYEAGTYENMAALATSDYVVITGALPISIKGRAFIFDGLGINLSIYKAPTYTGGTPVPYYNCNNWNPVPGLAQILGGITVTDAGIQVFTPEILLGSATQGNTTAANSLIESSGLEHILAPNTTYLFRRTNRANATQQVSTYNTWYEGPLDYNV